MKFMPHDYQTRAIQRIVNQDRVGLLLDMGLGKTVITLTAVQELVQDRFEVSRVLVIAPKRVAQRCDALAETADVYVIGRDNVRWLVDLCERRKCWPFDMVVIDELSSFKNPQAKRFRSLRKVMPAVKRVVGLTGTPSPNGLMDLWAEVYLLDGGKRLGRTLGRYRERWFRPAAMNGYVVYRWEPLRGAKREIESRLSDIF